MGRKDFSNPDTVKRGPGKAAKRQQDFKGTKTQKIPPSALNSINSKKMI